MKFRLAYIDFENSFIVNNNKLVVTTFSFALGTIAAIFVTRSTLRIP